jgi:hypothetical protein
VPRLGETEMAILSMSQAARLAAAAHLKPLPAIELHSRLTKLSVNAGTDDARRRESARERDCTLQSRAPSRLPDSASILSR